jgi:hypothetical protein
MALIAVDTCRRPWPKAQHVLLNDLPRPHGCHAAHEAGEIAFAPLELGNCGCGRWLRELRLQLSGAE